MLLVCGECGGGIIDHRYYYQFSGYKSGYRESGEEFEKRIIPQPPKGGVINLLSYAVIKKGGSLYKSNPP
jgi:hypothetical protein